MALKEKLLNVLREEIAEHGAAVGRFSAGEDEGAYLIRGDGKILGIGYGQEYQYGNGVKTLDDLNVEELGPILGRLGHIGPNAEYLDQIEREYCLTLTQGDVDWFLGKTNDLTSTPYVMRHTGNGRARTGGMGWAEADSQERQLKQNIQLRLVQHGDTRATTLTLPAGTTVNFNARQSVAMVGEGRERLFIKLDESYLSEIESTPTARRKTSP